MGEINLIPNDYRDWLGKKAMLVKYSIAITAISVGMLLLSTQLSKTAVSQLEHLSQLQAQNVVAQDQRGQLQLLVDQHIEFERQWSLLRGLRAGAAIDDIFSIIDRTIVAGDLWFDEWSVRRAGVIVDGQRRGVETGYFIVVADDATGGDPGNSDLSVETHMTINGQATDHQALSKFVRALFDQKDIRDVRIQQTSKTQFANGMAVNFDLTVILNSSLSDS